MHVNFNVFNSLFLIPEFLQNFYPLVLRDVLLKIIDVFTDRLNIVGLTDKLNIVGHLAKLRQEKHRFTSLRALCNDHWLHELTNLFVILILVVFNVISSFLLPSYLKFVIGRLSKVKRVNLICLLIPIARNNCLVFTQIINLFRSLALLCKSNQMSKEVNLVNAFSSLRKKLLLFVFVFPFVLIAIFFVIKLVLRLLDLILVCNFNVCASSPCVPLV